MDILYVTVIASGEQYLGSFLSAQHLKLLTWQSEGKINDSPIISAEELI